MSFVTYISLLFVCMSVPVVCMLINYVIGLVASEQLTGPPPPDMLTTALQMPYIQDMLTAMSQNEELCKKVKNNDIE